MTQPTSGNVPIDRFIDILANAKVIYQVERSLMSFIEDVGVPHAFLVPNLSDLPSKDPASYLLTVEALEELTGKTFFSNPEPTIAAAVKTTLPAELF